MSPFTFRNAFVQRAEKKAIIANDQAYTYSDLLAAIDNAFVKLERHGIEPGSVVEIFADFTLPAIAALFALIEKNCIVVPLTQAVKDNRSTFLDIAEVEFSLEFSDQGDLHVTNHARRVQHPLLLEIKDRNTPGLILFSSGSTGKPKAALHDFSLLLKKFNKPRSAKCMINFLLFDHIGGLNTLLHGLANGGTLVFLKERQPDAVCAAIEKHGVQVLPTSPSFLNLLILNKAYDRYDLKSLEAITYGTEVMPKNTLRLCNQLFPNINFSQTYGLSELGILRAKSKSSDSLFVKVGGEGYQTRIVDGMLEIKTSSAMLGYLNAPTPFTEDGWFKTNDMVEVLEDGYIKILGRTSDIINVGGEKVYPAEVESVMQMMPEVLDVTVIGEKNPILGQVVTAKVVLSHQENSSALRIKIREFCRQRLAAYKVPQKIIIVDALSYSERFKKVRG